MKNLYLFGVRVANSTYFSASIFLILYFQFGQEIQIIIRLNSVTIIWLILAASAYDESNNPKIPIVQKVCFKTLTADSETVRFVESHHCTYDYITWISAIRPEGTNFS